MRSVSAHPPAATARWTRPPLSPVPAVSAAVAPLPRVDEERVGLPFVLFCILAVILLGRPQDYFPVLRTVRPASLFTVLVILATAFQRRQPGPSPFRLHETKLLLSLFAVMLVGVPFSLYPTASLDYILNVYVQNVVFFVVFLYHITTIGRLKQLTTVLVYTSAFFIAMSLVYGNFTRAGRYSTLAVSTMYDPNDIAAVALAQLAFPIVALLGSFRTPVKLVALGTVVSGVLLAFYTGSRGGLVGLVTFLVLFLGLRIPRVSGWRKLLLVLVLLSGVLVNIDKINVERYLTLSSVEEDYNATGEFGRKEVWQRGLQFFWDDPLTGVGVSRFAEAIGTMRAADGVQPRWQAAHNSYIEILAETGIVGGILFVLLVVRSLVTFWAAGRAPPATETAGAPPGDLQIAGALFFTGMLAYSVTAFFLSYGYSVQFPLWFALAASFRQMAKRHEGRPAPAAMGFTTSHVV